MNGIRYYPRIGVSVGDDRRKVVYFWGFPTLSDAPPAFTGLAAQRLGFGVCFLSSFEIPKQAINETPQSSIENQRTIIIQLISISQKTLKNMFGGPILMSKGNLVPTCLFE